ncbi:hypothetical protein STXM2123_2063 [Streptomyces sp. F-3]|nr:hypothetical protein STXM2123_2063 [Streptomyces sp. F-3]
MKNSDGIGPTAVRAQAEVIAVRPVRIRDDSLKSSTEYSLAVHTGNS